MRPAGKNFGSAGIEVHAPGLEPWRLGETLNQEERTKGIEQVAMPHLDAAYNLARWLLRSEQDARDVVQEAYLWALRFIDGYRGGDG
jgi:DNA-directed RNA polymerase specialized sigma24 family protein